MKKTQLSLVFLAVALIMVFSLAACNNNTLDAYKTAGKTAIETYAQEHKDSYCEDNWTVVCGIVEVAKTEIDNAKSKAVVDSAVTTAKTKINEVRKKEAGMKLSFEEKAFGGQFIGLSGNESLSAIIRSQQELTSFFDEHDVNWGTTTPIGERYGGVFFQSKALMFYCFWATSTDISYSVDSINVDNGAITLALLGSSYGSAVNDMMQFVTILIEVEKSDMSDINSFSVYIRHKIL